MHGSSRWAVVTAATCVVILTVFAWRTATGRWTHGFSSYYTAARALVDGDFGPWVYDDAAFGARLQKVTQSNVLEVFVPNPPTMALLAVPVVSLDPRTARGVWLLASLTLFVAAVAWLAWSADKRATVWLVPALIAALLGGGVFSNLRTAQAYLVLAASAVLALALQKRGRDLLAGVALGFVVAVKLTAVPWLALITVTRGWRMLAGALLPMAILSGASIVLGGPGGPGGIDAWQRFPSALTEFVSRPGTMVTNYQTVLGFVRHACVADPVVNPEPLASCPSLVPILPMLIGAATFVWTAWTLRGSRPELVAAAGLCLSVMLVPIAAEHVYVLMVIPLFVLMPTYGGVWAWVWLMAAALLVVPAELSIHRFTDGPLALLGYPRLYAAYLLWVKTLADARRERQRVGTAVLS